MRKSLSKSRSIVKQAGDFFKKKMSMERSKSESIAVYDAILSSKNQRKAISNVPNTFNQFSKKSSLPLRNMVQSLRKTKS
jgi:hypothetical protein